MGVLNLSTITSREEWFKGNMREMRCKIADKSTGQLALYWVVIYKQDKTSETRYISEFDLLPQ